MTGDGSRACRNFHPDLANAIDDACRRLGYRPAARALGVSPGYLHLLAHGKRKPSIVVAEILIAGLRLDHDVAFRLRQLAAPTRVGHHHGDAHKPLDHGSRGDPSRAFSMRSSAWRRLDGVRHGRSRLDALIGVRGGHGCQRVACMRVACGRNRLGAPLRRLTKASQSRGHPRRDPTCTPPLPRQQQSGVAQGLTRRATRWSATAGSPGRRVDRTLTDCWPNVSFRLRRVAPTTTRWNGEGPPVQHQQSPAF
jgi:hypothetical protein